MSKDNMLRAGGLIVFRRMQHQIEYLLLQTSYGQHHWTPPKGHLDPGEDYMTAALRETEEEAGFTPEQLTVTDFKSVLHYEVKRRPKEVIYWLAELKDPTTPVKLSREHQALAWCVVGEACRLSGFQDLQKVFRDADDYVKKSGL